MQADPRRPIDAGEGRGKKRGRRQPAALGYTVRKKEQNHAALRSRYTPVPI
jgi:hypothetical protein